MDSKAIEHLRQPKSQRQLDEDGVEVGISRQAVDEAVRDYDALAARLASVERERNEIMAMAERREGKLQARLAAAEALLRELVAMIHGECPSLLDEDRGGDVRLALRIDALLAKIKEQA